MDSQHTPTTQVSDDEQKLDWRRLGFTQIPNRNDYPAYVTGEAVGYHETFERRFTTTEPPITMF